MSGFIFGGGGADGGRPGPLKMEEDVIEVISLVEGDERGQTQGKPGPGVSRGQQQQWHSQSQPDFGRPVVPPGMGTGTAGQKVGPGVGVGVGAGVNPKSVTKCLLNLETVRFLHVENSKNLEENNRLKARVQQLEGREAENRSLAEQLKGATEKLQKLQKEEELNKQRILQLETKAKERKADGVKMWELLQQANDKLKDLQKEKEENKQYKQRVQELEAKLAEGAGICGELSGQLKEANDKLQGLQRERGELVRQLNQTMALLDRALSLMPGVTQMEGEVVGVGVGGESSSSSASFTTAQDQNSNLGEEEPPELTYYGATATASTSTTATETETGSLIEELIGDIPSFSTGRISQTPPNGQRGTPMRGQIQPGSSGGRRRPVKQTGAETRGQQQQLRRRGQDRMRLGLRPNPPPRMRRPLTTPRTSRFRIGLRPTSTLNPTTGGGVHRGSGSDKSSLHHGIDQSKANENCCLCGKLYPNRQLLLSHLKYFNEERKFECERCGRRFFLMNHLRNHLAQSYGVALPVEMMGCRGCGGIFDNARALQMHKRSMECEMDS